MGRFSHYEAAFCIKGWKYPIHKKFNLHTIIGAACPCPVHPPAGPKQVQLAPDLHFPSTLLHRKTSLWGWFMTKWLIFYPKNLYVKLYNLHTTFTGFRRINSQWKINTRTDKTSRAQRLLNYRLVTKYWSWIFVITGRLCIYFYIYTFFYLLICCRF